MNRPKLTSEAFTSCCSPLMTKITWPSWRASAPLFLNSWLILLPTRKAQEYCYLRWASFYAQDQTTYPIICGFRDVYILVLLHNVLRLFLGGGDFCFRLKASLAASVQRKSSVKDSLKCRSNKKQLVSPTMEMLVKRELKLCSPSHSLINAGHDGFLQGKSYETCMIDFFIPVAKADKEGRRQTEMFFDRGVGFAGVSIANCGENLEAVTVSPTFVWYFSYIISVNSW